MNEFIQLGRNNVTLGFFLNKIIGCINILNNTIKTNVTVDVYIQSQA